MVRYGHFSTFSVGIKSEPRPELTFNVIKNWKVRNDNRNRFTKHSLCRMDRQTKERVSLYAEHDKHKRTHNDMFVEYTSICFYSEKCRYKCISFSCPVLGCIYRSDIALSSVNIVTFPLHNVSTQLLLNYFYQVFHLVLKPELLPSYVSQLLSCSYD